MRNRGKRSYLKPVHHDILLIELMYEVFSHVAPPNIYYKNNDIFEYNKTINFRDILAVLLTSKNWCNLFKNYVINTAKKIFADYYFGFKSSLGIFSKFYKISDCTGFTWYKHISHFKNFPIIVLNRRLIGNYGRVVTLNKVKTDYNIRFNIDNTVIIAIHYDKNIMLYRLTGKDQYKYICYGECNAGRNLTRVLHTPDLAKNIDVDKPIIDFIIKKYQLFE